ncbi:hypothetical protein LSAT2_028273 [Lamellibrachia satsuma]|nr:hypothetical protein LSAT2_028273 [Lamellibrachia satsuma]
MDALLAAPYINIICMLAVSIVMVTVLSLCACKSKEPRDEDVEGNEAVEKGSGKKQNRGSVKQKNDAVADTDVVIETVTAGQEGEAAGDKAANGRPL